MIAPEDYADCQRDVVALVSACMARDEIAARCILENTDLRATLMAASCMMAAIFDQWKAQGVDVDDMLAQLRGAP